MSKPAEIGAVAPVPETDRPPSRLQLNPETRLRQAEDGRRTLFESKLGLVEDITVSPSEASPVGHTSVFLISLH